MAYGRRSNVMEVVGDAILGDIMGDILGENYGGVVGFDLAAALNAVAPPVAAASQAKSWRQGGGGGMNIANLHPAVKAALVQAIANGGGGGGGGMLPPAAGAGMQNVQIPQRPQWREGQAAPGVMLPDEGMVPLGLTPDDGTGTFTATSPGRITWIGRMQKPYRAERLLVSSVRTGATATGRALGQFFVGVDLNQGTLQPVDIELIGAATAFGTRLTLLQAPPGVELSVPVSLSSTPTGTDSIFLTLMWTGRIVH